MNKETFLEVIDRTPLVSIDLIMTWWAKDKLLGNTKVHLNTRVYFEA